MKRILGMVAAMSAGLVAGCGDRGAMDDSISEHWGCRRAIHMERGLADHASVVAFQRAEGIGLIVNYIPEAPGKAGIVMHLLSEAQWDSGSLSGRLSVRTNRPSAQQILDARILADGVGATSGPDKPASETARWGLTFPAPGEMVLREASQTSDDSRLVCRELPHLGDALEVSYNTHKQMLTRTRELLREPWFRVVSRIRDIPLCRDFRKEITDRLTLGAAVANEVANQLAYRLDGMGCLGEPRSDFEVIDEYGSVYPEGDMMAFVRAYLPPMPGAPSPSTPTPASTPVSTPVIQQAAPRPAQPSAPPPPQRPAPVPDPEEREDMQAATTASATDDCEENPTQGPQALTAAQASALASAGWLRFGNLRRFASGFDGAEVVFVPVTKGFGEQCYPEAMQEAILVGDALVGEALARALRPRVDGAVREVRQEGDGHFLIEYAAYAAGDPSCCPSMQFTGEVRLAKEEGSDVVTVKKR